MSEFAWDIKTSSIVSCENCNMFAFVLSCKTTNQHAPQQLPEEILEVHDVFEG